MQVLSASLIRLGRRLQTEIRRFLEQQKAALIELSPSVKATLRSDVASWRNTTEQQLVNWRHWPLDPTILRYILLPYASYRRATFIGQLEDDPNSGPIKDDPNSFLDQEQKSWNNFTKLRLNWYTPAKNGREVVGFGFYWQNFTGSTVLFNDISSPLILNGFCSAQVDGGVWAQNHAFVDISAELHVGVYDGYQSHRLISPPQEGSMYWRGIAAIGADARGLSLGSYESAGVNGFYNLEYKWPVMVPGQTALGIEVDVLVYHDISGEGAVTVDFASGDFEAMFPCVVLQKVTSDVET